MAGRLNALQGRRRDDFARWLKDNRPDLVLSSERSIVPLVGRVGWGPGDEKPEPGICRKCWGDIKPGSILFCPKCDRSGFERRLAKQRAISPPPRPDPRPRASKSNPARSRRERRGATA